MMMKYRFKITLTKYFILLAITFLLRTEFVLATPPYSRDQPLEKPSDAVCVCLQTCDSKWWNWVDSGYYDRCYWRRPPFLSEDNIIRDQWHPRPPVREVVVCPEENCRPYWGVSPGDIVYYDNGRRAVFTNLTNWRAPTCGQGIYKSYGQPGDFCHLGEKAWRRNIAVDYGPNHTSWEQAYCEKSPECDQVYIKYMGARVYPDPKNISFRATGSTSDGLTGAYLGIVPDAVATITNGSYSFSGKDENNDGYIRISLPDDYRVTNPKCFNHLDEYCQGEWWHLEIRTPSKFESVYGDFSYVPFISQAPYIEKRRIFILPEGGRTGSKDPFSTPISEATPIVTSTPDPATPTSYPVSDCPRKSEGDANCDGVINVLDFSIWRREKYDLGADEIQGEWQADFNGDGYVRNDDFSIWLNNLE